MLFTFFCLRVNAFFDPIACLRILENVHEATLTRWRIGGDYGEDQSYPGFSRFLRSLADCSDREDPKATLYSAEKFQLLLSKEPPIPVGDASENLLSNLSIRAGDGLKLTARIDFPWAEFPAVLKAFPFLGTVDFVGRENHVIRELVESQLLLRIFRLRIRLAIERQMELLAAIVRSPNSRNLVALNIHDLIMSRMPVSLSTFRSIITSSHLSSLKELSLSGVETPHILSLAETTVPSLERVFIERIRLNLRDKSEISIIKHLNEWFRSNAASRLKLISIGSIDSGSINVVARTLGGDFPNLKGLRHLHLGQDLGVEGLRSIGSSPHLHIQRLSLKTGSPRYSGELASPRGVEVLFTSPAFRGLTHLCLSGVTNRSRRRSLNLRYLTRYSLRHLVHLDVSHNSIIGVKPFVASPLAGQLKSLFLNHTQLSHYQFKILVNAKFPKLKELALVGMDAQLVKQLIESPLLRQIEFLYMDNPSLSEQINEKLGRTVAVPFSEYMSEEMYRTGLRAPIDS